MIILRILKAYWRLMWFRLSVEEEYREAICEDCDELESDKYFGYTCGVCGCPIAAKVRDIEEGCPLNKW